MCENLTGLLGAATQGAWLPAAMPYSSPALNGHHQAASDWKAR